MTDATEPGAIEEPRASLSLWDWRRRVTALYARVRSQGPAEGWKLWHETRTELFRRHDQSPVPPGERAAFPGLALFPYDPGLRFELEVVPAAGGRLMLPHSGDGGTEASAFGKVVLPLDGSPELNLYWLDDYGGGVLLPFRDATSGAETYGGGRYLLDTAKGADLGATGDRIVLDFNFSYHPSCVHDVRWSCPLAPPENRVAVPIRGGERLA